jgi:type II secretory pathway pseudopilin PulG
LVELLVVISIIALLVSILLPALGQAREQAKQVYCQTCMHQLSIAMTTYTNDYRYIVPARRDYAPNHSGISSGSLRPPGGWWYSRPSDSTGELPISGTAYWFWQQIALDTVGGDLKVMGCVSSKVTKPDDTGNLNQKYVGNYGINGNLAFHIGDTLGPQGNRMKLFV